MNQLAPNNTASTLPAHLQRLAGGRVATAALGGLNTGSPPHVSIRMNRFTLVDAAGNKKPLESFHLDCVIVDANPHQSKVYYAQAFDPNAEDFAPPDCFSDNGVGASAQALKPQSQRCAQCPMNVWGSATSKATGKPTKACNDVKKIALVLPADPDMVFLLRIPPASLKLLGAYIRTVAGNGAEITMVTTRISFDPQTQGVLNFNAVGWIDERMAGRVAQLSDGKATADMLGLDDQPWTGAAPAPVIAAPMQAPTQQIPPPPPFNPAMAPPPINVPSFVVPQPAPTYPQSFSGGAPTPSFMPPVAGVGASPAFGTNTPAPAEPEKRKRRTKAEMEAERAKLAGTTQQQQQLPAFMQPAPAQMPPQPAVNIDAPMEIPAFLRNNGQAQPAPQQQYGMVANAPAPDAGLAAALEAALKLPTT